MAAPTERLLWALVLRALATILYRQAFPDFREHDADWERSTNAQVTELRGIAAEIEEKATRVAP